MKAISRYSKASVHFPTSSDSIAPTSYFISGTAMAVLTATKCFQVMTPSRRNELRR